MDTKILNPASEADIALAGKLLRQGGLVAIPTETVYGLAANALDPEAAKRIYTVKGRPSDNPLIVHISKFEEMIPLVRYVPQAAYRLAEAFWPGPLTIILPKTQAIPSATSGGLDTVAIRLPGNPIARRVIEAAGCPLAAPSANLSGRPSPTTFSRVCHDLLGKVEGIVDGGNCAVGVESTVLTLVPPVPKLLRPGGITVEQLRQVLGEVEVDEAVVHQLGENQVPSSPGMKYKHYSPVCDIILADCSKEQFIRLVNESPDRDALCFEGEEAFLTKACVTYGREYDGSSQARRLFSALCELDEKNMKKVYARRPLKTGVGLAVYNRLIRAAGFQIYRPEERVIGLTGQTGAGKSTVAGLLQSAGFQIIDCDKLTKSGIYDARCLEELAQAFGGDILAPDGSLDRRLLARRAFSSPENTEILNRITLPRILRRLGEKLREMHDGGIQKIVLDAPTLFESGADAFCSRVISVTAPQSLRLSRVMERDGLSREDACLRMSAQKPDDFYLDRSDYVLVNNEKEDSLAAAVREIMEEV